MSDQDNLSQLRALEARLTGELQAAGAREQKQNEAFGVFLQTLSDQNKALQTKLGVALAAQAPVDVSGDVQALQTAIESAQALGLRTLADFGVSPVPASPAAPAAPAIAPAADPAAPAADPAAPAADPAAPAVDPAAPAVDPAAPAVDPAAPAVDASVNGTVTVTSPVSVTTDPDTGHTVIVAPPDAVVVTPAGDAPAAPAEQPQPAPPSDPAAGVSAGS